MVSGVYYLREEALLFQAMVTDATLAGDRAVVLVFPEWDASGYVTEERQIPSRNRPGEDLAFLRYREEVLYARRAPSACAPHSAVLDLVLEHAWAGTPLDCTRIKRG